MSRKTKLAECYTELPNVMSLCPYFLSDLLECESNLTSFYHLQLLSVILSPLCFPVNFQCTHGMQATTTM